MKGIDLTKKKGTKIKQRRVQHEKLKVYLDNEEAIVKRKKITIIGLIQAKIRVRTLPAQKRGLASADGIH